jgi:hypothetical protein
LSKTLRWSLFASDLPRYAQSDGLQIVKICYNKFVMDNQRDMAPLHKFGNSINFKLLIAVLVISVIAGVGTGYLAASSGAGGGAAIPLVQKTPEHATEDTRTFRDFAEGKVTKKPDNDKNSQGTHLLIRDGATPVLLTSSVLDLSEYENKKVKIYGETNSLPGAGWFMDVGRVEVIQ